MGFCLASTPEYGAGRCGKPQGASVKVALGIINSRTVLPLRFVSENLDATVVWEQSTQTITITYTS
ncbi:MAG: stalk domain-containing protein [Candidatus Cryosericum sp.]